jgi:hypothetical protein
MSSTFSTKRKTKISFLNVRTLRESVKLKQVAEETDILGLGEEIWPDFGEVATQNGITFLSA